METRSMRISCAILKQTIRLTRCTELLLERFGVMPETTLAPLIVAGTFTRRELDDTCRACPFNPVEDPPRAAAPAQGDEAIVAAAA